MCDWNFHILPSRLPVNLLVCALVFAAQGVGRAACADEEVLLPLIFGEYRIAALGDFYAADFLRKPLEIRRSVRIG